jgi:hypothetical protein
MSRLVRNLFVSRAGKPAARTALGSLDEPIGPTMTVNVRGRTLIISQTAPDPVTVCYAGGGKLTVNTRAGYTTGPINAFLDAIEFFCAPGDGLSNQTSVPCLVSPRQKQPLNRLLTGPATRPTA